MIDQNVNVHALGVPVDPIPVIVPPVRTAWFATTPATLRLACQVKTILWLASPAPKSPRPLPARPIFQFIAVIAGFDEKTAPELGDHFDELHRMRS